MEKSLAQQYIDYMDSDCPAGNTWDDFFDHVNIPKENRTDFAVAAIMKQVCEIKGIKLSC